MHGRAQTLLALGASALLTTRAEASTSAHLVYVRNPSAVACPDEAGLRQAVKQRVGYDPFFPWAKTTVVVEVTNEAHSFVAHVQLVGERGVSLGVRDLRSGANGCPGLIEAVALEISIALELSASPSLAPASGPAPSSSISPAPSSTPAPPSVPSSAPTASTDAPLLDPDKTPSSAASRLRGAVGFDTLAVIAETPDVVAGFDLWVDARLGIGSLGFEVRGDVPSSVAFASGGSASVFFFAATMAPCAHAGLFFACALGAIGLVHASGNADVLVPRSGSAFALAVGPRIGFEVPLGRSFALRVRGDLLVNSLRPTVSVNGALWPLPAFSGITGAGLAYRFP